MSLSSQSASFLSDSGGKPDFSTREAERFASTLYGLEAEATPLASYSDQNFHLCCPDGRAFVLKIANAGESEQELDFQQQALRFLETHAPGLNLPRVRLTSSGERMTRVPSPRTSSSHVVWLVTFLSGTIFSDLSEHPPGLLSNIGRFLGSLDRALDAFMHPAMHRFMPWDLKQTGRLRPNLAFIADPVKKKLAERFLDRFDEAVLPRLAALRSSVIYNDANDNNIIVAASGDRWQAAGLIDFGDMVYTNTICEPAIAIAYLIMGKRDILETASHVLRGYHSTYPVTREEIDLLFDLIGARLCMSVCMSALERSRDPGNTYLAVSEQPAWETLERLASIDPEKARRTFQKVTALSR